MRRRTAVAAVAVLLLGAGAGASFGPSSGHRPRLDGGLYYRGNAVLHPAPQVARSAWCGTDAVSEDRMPDAVAGPLIHVIYAFPSDGQDRFAALAPAIATDVAAIDSWWRAQDPSRAPRFDLYSFPGCAPGFGQLDITRVRLSQPTGYYSPVDTRADRIIFELGAQFGDPFKKYLVYFDGAVDEPRLCGESLLSPDQGGRFAFSVIYDQACHPDLGAGSGTAHVAAHELAHNLGAVPAGGPPHACPGNTSHVCDSEDDLMYPFTKGQPVSAITLDVGRDDYYAHSGSWWDLQDSPWLSHLDAPQVPLSVTVAGSGSGAVASDVPGVQCPPGCSSAWDQGSKLELSAAAGDNTRFVGWSGACTSEPCDVTMSSARSVVARFAAQVVLTVSVKGTRGATGSVAGRPAAISCPGTCQATVDQGTRVQLVATPGRSSVLAGWSGACTGRAACVVAVGSSSTVTATFAPAPLFVPPKAKTVPKCKKGQRPTKVRPCRR